MKKHNRPHIKTLSLENFRDSASIARKENRVYDAEIYEYIVELLVERKKEEKVKNFFLDLCAEVHALKMAFLGVEAMLDDLADGLGVEVPVEWCEGCDAPATTHDAEGVPLCQACYEDLVQEEKAKAQAPTEDQT